MLKITTRERLCLTILKKKGQWVTASVVSGATSGKLTKGDVRGEFYSLLGERLESGEPLMEVRTNSETSKTEYRILNGGKIVLKHKREKRKKKKKK